VGRSYGGNNPDLNMTLLEVIGQRTDLSKFYEYLRKTGLDKELSSSKTYTVWAPRNEAWQTIDPAVVADSARLRQLIANHISYQSYFTRNAVTPARVAMLNGKRVSFSRNKFDDANITEADKYVANGVLHIIDKIAPVYANAWELVNNTKTSFRQHAFIASLTRNVFDPQHAVVDSINAQTGKPIYRPGTDSVLRNRFNTEVYDLQNEEKQYTYFILNDAAFDSEVNKLIPYYQTSTADSTKDLAAAALVKDLIVEGLYTIDQLPAVLTSKFGVPIPIDKNKIVETRRMSNGIAYVMSGVNFNAKDKLPDIIIQGEQYLSFFTAAGLPATPRQNNVSAVFNRARVNPVTGQPFTDMFVYNHGIAGLNVQYQALHVPSVNYKVYWVAVNDTLIVDRGNRVNPATFRQRLAMGSQTATNFPLKDVTPNTFTEVYLGDYKQPSFGPLNMFLTANGTSSLTLDYIRLVPDL
jgi:hypothetical protein